MDGFDFTAGKTDEVTDTQRLVRLRIEHTAVRFGRLLEGEGRQGGGTCMVR